MVLIIPLIFENHQKQIVFVSSKSTQLMVFHSNSLQICAAGLQIIAGEAFSVVLVVFVAGRSQSLVVVVIVVVVVVVVVVMS